MVLTPCVRTTVERPVFYQQTGSRARKKANCVGWLATGHEIPHACTTVKIRLVPTHATGMPNPWQTALLVGSRGALSHCCGES